MQTLYLANPIFRPSGVSESVGLFLTIYLPLQTIHIQYVVLSRSNRNRIIKSEQILIGCCVMAHFKGLDDLYLGQKKKNPKEPQINT